jgi:L-2-hydroxycarboxylate dehydrogenase (NAD+)
MASTPSTDRRFQSRDLESFVARSLTAVGLPTTDAEQVARLMILADLRGSDGHGIFRLPQYVRRIRAGGMNLQPNIHVVQETDAAALVDGDNGMGHLVMRFAAQLAMDKAGRAGVSWVGVRRSNHAGPAALYAMMPLERDMIGIYIAVGSANHMPPLGWSRTATEYESDRVRDSGFPRTADRSRYRHQCGGVRQGEDQSSTRRTDA